MVLLAAICVRAGTTFPGICVAASRTVPLARMQLTGSVH